MGSKSDGSKKIPIPLHRRIVRDTPWFPVAVILAILVLSVYRQVGDYAYASLDDQQYITGNPVVLRGLTLEGVSWAFTTFHASNWHPLTWLSHMLDVELFGPSAGWHHRVNVLFHLLNTEFLFLVLWRMTGGLWQSAFVAALFGVHPLHVESVAWVSERKDVLSTLFWILTMGAYLRYVRRPGIGRYLLLAAVFALGLMCKPMLVTLPFVLLLLDFWPLNRLPLREDFSRDVLKHRLVEKFPLFVLSTASCMVTFAAQYQGGAMGSLQRYPLWIRAGNAAVSYWTYAWKTLWPSALTLYYPYPKAGLEGWRVALALFFLVGVTWLAVRCRGNRPYVSVGWLWYTGTLVPVIGLVQVGGQSMADRYMYVPMVGLSLSMAWGVPELLSGWRWRKWALGAAGGFVVTALAFTSWVQAGYWRDNFTLFGHALAVTRDNWLAHLHLGVSFQEKGRNEEAALHYGEALRLLPHLVEAHNDLGNVLLLQGRQEEAAYHYTEALRIRPYHTHANTSLGIILYRQGRTDEAIDHFRLALQGKHENAEAHYHLGMALQQQGRNKEAIYHYSEALRFRPGDPVIRSLLGMASSSRNR